MTLDRKWERFTGGPSSARGEQMRITLNRHGEIYLNRKAYDAFGRPEAVALYYNREDDSIAVEPAFPRFAENFQLVKKQVGWSIHAAPFCRHYGIRIPTTERFTQPNITPEGHLILNLKQTVTVGGVRASKEL